MRLSRARAISLPEIARRKDELGDLARSLEAMTQPLSERMDAIEAFAADVAHEIRNPLTSIRSAVETLELVKAKPGITIPEIATQMGIKQNYLYRVLPGLEKDGKVVKRDRGWHAAA